MSAEHPPVPLPPPPLQPDAEPEPDWRLSWWTVLYLAVASVPAAFGSLVVFRTANASASPLTVSWQLMPLTLGTVSMPIQFLWGGTMLGLGLALADRLAPPAWSRRLRWAVAAGLSRLVPWPPHATGWLQDLTHTQAASLLFTLPNSVLAVACSAFVGFYVARAIRPGVRLWRRLPLVGLEAELITTIAGFAVTCACWYAAASQQGVPTTPGWLWFAMLWLAVVKSAAIGPLLGLGLAAGITPGPALRGEP